MMPPHVVFLAAITFFGPPVRRDGLPGDVGNPNPSLACARQLYGEPRDIQDDSHVLASYYWPCGTKLEICAESKNATLCTIADVMDRGPQRGRLCSVRDKGDPKCLIPGLYIHDVDASYPVGRELGLVDEQGRTTKACRGMRQANGKFRGCSIWYRVVFWNS